MATQLTQDQFVEILRDTEITHPKDIFLFQTLYSFEHHKAYGSQVGERMGYTGKSPQGPVNLQIGRIAKRIAQKYDIDFTRRQNEKYKYWDLFFDGWAEGQYWVWQLKPALVGAMIETSLTSPS